MTQPTNPNITPAPWIHNPSKPQIPPGTPKLGPDLEKWAKSLFDAIAKRVLNALTGGLVKPGSVEAALQAWSNSLASLSAAIDGAVAAIRDDLTSVVNSTPTDLDNWLLDLLTRSSELDAANLVNLPNIGEIAQDKVHDLVTDLAGLGTTAGDALTGVGGVIDNIVLRLRAGLSGSGFTQDDAASALAMTQSTIAETAAAIAALQAQASEAINSGTSVVVDFSGLPDASGLPSAFTQTYSGSGGSTLGVRSGRAHWMAVIGSDRTCLATHATQTLTDYQKVGFAAGSTPGGGLTQKAANYILGRVNSAGTSYVYVRFDRYSLEIGCVVSGTKTVWDTGVSHTFSSSAGYWLECGTSGGSRIFRVWRNSTIIYTWVEVGTTSQLGSSYRYVGFGGFADMDSFSGWVPGDAVAFAFFDNTPQTYLGSVARYYRASTTGVSHNGSVQVANSFFDTPDYITADITWDGATHNKFTVSQEGLYYVAIRVVSPTATANDKQRLTIWKNGAVAKWLGLSAGAGTQGVTSDGLYATGHIYLKAGDYVQPGVEFTGAFNLTGESSGVQSYFEIGRVA